MTTITTRTSPRDPAAARRPVTATVVVALTVLQTLFAGYGAVYFTLLDGVTDMALTFLLTFESVTAFGLLSALALARRSALGRAGVVVYGVWMLIFSAFKIGYIHEAAAVPFAVVGLLVLGLALAPGTRRYADR
ncbi:hypothetical protein [Nocardioides mesophilus]|uniref:hypothetical protein n=1 Tax=Nocardioides mesophilus TaxID=433659 RepID=UPI001FEB1874|nr:hypothetical protein [Nocardioides mesophilus]